MSDRILNENGMIDLYENHPDMLSMEVQESIRNTYKPWRGRSKHIKAKNIDTGEVLYFSSLSSASEYLSVSISAISMALNGQRYRANRWTFEEDKSASFDNL